jgi:hypothetical protein
MAVIKPQNVSHRNIFTSAKVPEYDQSSLDPYDLYTNAEEYLTPNSVAETTPR